MSLRLSRLICLLKERNFSPNICKPIFPCICMVLLLAGVSSRLWGSDARVRLNSNDGSTSFQVQDNGANVVGEIDSDGNLVLAGSGTVSNGLIVNSGNFGIGTVFAESRIRAVSPAGATGPQFLISTGTTKLFEVNGASVALGVTLRWPDGSSQNTAMTSQWSASGADIYNANAGNVGIGINPPTARLHVSSGAASLGPVMLVSTGSTKLFEVTGTSLTISVPSNTVILNGNVGIGTIAPAAPLHIMSLAAGGAPFIGQMLIEPGVANADAGISLKNTESPGNIWTILAGNGTGTTNLRFYDSTAGQDRMNIDSNGNVGIGTVGPSAQFSLGNTLANTKLALYDSGGVFFGLGIQNGEFRLHTSAPSDKFSFLNSPSGFTLVTIQGDGKVGIGTAAPGAVLHISSASAPAHPILLVSTGSAKLFEVGGTSVSIFATDRTIIQSTLVGIGTSDPSSRFDLLDGSITIRGNNARLRIAANAGASVNNDAMIIVSTGATNYFRVSSTGTVSVYGRGGFQTSGADVAEMYPSDEKLEAGDLVVSAGRGKVKRSEGSSSSESLLGIVSKSPGFVAGGNVDIDPKDIAGQYPIALVGRTPVKVSLENGPIHAGDRLTASAVKGVAAKAVKTGRVVAIALDSFEGDMGKQGSVMAFVNLSYWVHPDDVKNLRERIAAAEARLDKLSK